MTGIGGAAAFGASEFLSRFSETALWLSQDKRTVIAGIGALWGAMWVFLVWAIRTRRRPRTALRVSHPVLRTVFALILLCTAVGLTLVYQGVVSEIHREFTTDLDLKIEYGEQLPDTLERITTTRYRVELPKEWPPDITQQLDAIVKARQEPDPLGYKLANSPIEIIEWTQRPESRRQIERMRAQLSAIHLAILGLLATSLASFLPVGWGKSRHSQSGPAYDPTSPMHRPGDTVERQ